VKPALLSVAQIALGGGTQARESLSVDAIDDYAAAYAAKAPMPPVVVFLDGDGAHWLADGFHRVEAARRAGVLRVPADVHKGTQRDAILWSVAANSAHGLRRTNADKRRAVETLLADTEWSGWSDRKIAVAAGVGPELVASMRPQLSETDSSKRIGLDGKARRLPQKDSRSGQPTPVSPPSAGNQREGEKGAGAGLAVPAPRMPYVWSKEAGPTGWAAQAATAALVEADKAVQRAQAAITGCKEMPPHEAQRLKKTLQAAGAELREAQPSMDCPFCKDPLGDDGRRAACTACGDYGCLTRAQAANVPRELLLEGVQARVSCGNGETWLLAQWDTFVKERDEAVAAGVAMRRASPPNLGAWPAPQKPPVKARELQIQVERDDGTVEAFAPVDVGPPTDEEDVAF
jgi:hypothetical protein